MSNLYILVFHDGDYIKIGKADDIHARIAALQRVWGPVDYAASYYLHAPLTVVRQVEGALLSLLARFAVSVLEGDGRTGTSRKAGTCDCIAVSAGVKMTHRAGIKLTHLGEDGGFLAAEDVDSGAISGNQGFGAKRNGDTGNRAAIEVSRNLCMPTSYAAGCCR